MCGDGRRRAVGRWAHSAIHRSCITEMYTDACVTLLTNVTLVNLIKKEIDGQRRLFNVKFFKGQTEKN